MARGLPFTLLILTAGDKSGSKCLRCQRSGRECVPAPGKSEEVSFRHGQNPSLRGKGPPRYGESDLAFPDDQVWVETSTDCALKKNPPPAAGVCALTNLR